MCYFQGKYSNQMNIKTKQIDDCSELQNNTLTNNADNNFLLNTDLDQDFLPSNSKLFSGTGELININLANNENKNNDGNNSEIESSDVPNIFETDSSDDPNYQTENNLSDSSESSEQTVINNSKSRKRKRIPHKWKCNIRKEKRSAGQEYISKRGKLTPARIMKQPCNSNCRTQCTKKLTHGDRQEIFANFWRKECSNDQKRLFVASCISKMPVQRRRLRIENDSENLKRTNTLKYYFEVKNVRENVCKTFFLNTLCVSDSYIKTALEKKRTGGLVSPDKRGKKTPPNKLPDCVRENIRWHINSFPKIESHYSRARSSRMYLGCDLNLAKMYQLYVEHCKEQKLEENFIGKEWLYHDIFNSEFNLAFKQPANDTCDTCDEHIVRIKQASPDEKIEIEQNYNSHLVEAQKRYDEKRADKFSSKDNQTKQKVIMIDLQKCLPTPSLSNSQAFYLRKLWTLNLTIFDATTGKSFCAMWDETVGARGANEVSSCVYKWAMSEIVGTEIEEITIWTDNCAGQNRNLVLAMCYFWLVNCVPNLKKINHKFLLKGHTHMEVDGVHSVIEHAKKKLKHATMMIPWDWQQFVRNLSFKEPIIVYDMTLKDFYNFRSLFENSSSPFIKRKKGTEKQQFQISETVHLQVRNEEFGILYYKTSFDGEFKKINLNRNVRRDGVLPSALPLINTKPRSINLEKYRDLQTALKWVPTVFHQFYKDIPNASSVLDYPDENEVEDE